MNSDPCVHHWRLETPDGGRDVPGTCLKCHETRRFRSSEDRWGAIAGDDLHFLFTSEKRPSGEAW